MKKGVLVVSFGTTYKDTREKNIKAVEKMVQEAYPEMVCRRAFSSGSVRRKLKERDGLLIMDTREALTQLKKDGITHVYILPTYVIDGIESNRLKREAELWSGEFTQIHIGEPLLARDEDYEKVVEALVREYLTEEEPKILVLIGHGTEHEAQNSYGHLEDTFRKMGHSDVYVATVEKEDDLDALIERMRTDGKVSGNVILAPLMLVAGDHATNDIAGEDDSYLNRLCAEGYHVQAMIRGLGECAGIRDIYLSHLKDVI